MRTGMGLAETLRREDGGTGRRAESPYESKGALF
jgi:hypothetical protein